MANTNSDVQAVAEGLLRIIQGASSPGWFSYLAIIESNRIIMRILQ